jgi:hypothetical protein
MQQQQEQQHHQQLPLSYSHHATITYREVRSAGAPVRPLDFPPPKVRAGVRVNALVVHPQTGSRQVCSGVIHREDLSSTYNNQNNRTSAKASTVAATTMASSTMSTTSPGSNTVAPNKGVLLNRTKNSKQKATVAVSPDSQQSQYFGTEQDTSSIVPCGNERDVQNDVKNTGNLDVVGDTSSCDDDVVFAYWPQRRLQDAIYGSVWACLVLRRHYGTAADDAARAANVEPGSPEAPIVWEITGTHVAIKMVEWSRVHHMRGRLLEDPVKEVAALQMLDKHPNVLHSTEVLQDSDFLYSVMPFCRDGDLFGIVVKYAEDSGGEIGMPEPVARYWFRQILNVCFSVFLLLYFFG